MNSGSFQVERPALQRLLVRRFGMAVATYGLALLLFWLAASFGLLRDSLGIAVLFSALVVASQLVFLALFASGLNRRFKDPSLTEPQVLTALFWHTCLLALLENGRGPLLVLYAVILMFGIFQLPPRVFIRCSILAFAGFLGLVLWELGVGRLADPPLALLEVCVLLLVLVWLSLFSSYVQSLRQRMRKRRFALQAHQDTLRNMMRQLEAQVATDELTGLFNRRHFLRLAERALEELDAGRQHGLALIDLDHFKQINDHHGHAGGDRVLQTFAAVARARLRDGDILARYGGEEFVLLLPDADADRVASCCERLREAFASAEPVGVAVERLSLSVGMPLLRAGDQLDEALHRADQALYRAKRNGRNRCDAAWEKCDA
ncbi:GGDEF domain-containing protein [Zestomonas thermotolerans]|uniref:GGDEF domain-containing protein n=1 Tax=Zestomonas thermotolerans TaxID=157784 RepID=UPI0004835DF4|nr:GGDEF domain-containing protein [Pseudomonas thermotolerans]